MLIKICHFANAKWRLLPHKRGEDTIYYLHFASKEAKNIYKSCKNKQNRNPQSAALLFYNLSHK
jgi:hypothetical protein